MTSVVALGTTKPDLRSSSSSTCASQRIELVEYVRLCVSWPGFGLQ
jgi:hypothetical protein